MFVDVIMAVGGRRRTDGQLSRG